MAKSNYNFPITRSIGWRLGLQALTGIVFSTFILGLFYRSATLYHPQRRAILHLKTQKKKIKDKNKSKEDIPPFFDTTCLKSKTIQIILLSTGFGALGVNTPLYYLVNQLTYDGYRERSVVMIMIYLAASWTLGCCLFGCLVLQRSLDCRIGRQYLCQVSLVVCGLSILALTSVKVGTRNTSHHLSCLYILQRNLYNASILFSATQKTIFPKNAFYFA